ncbi:alpha/beta fold hydrolase [Novosphingobium profundi]|uniref:alpha/beta fold hydrolase n=1 Tax=Novosphingobium profundi TaxID=1774954 RepID=UPI001BD94E55|nr:alpha/beta fold hydrolase [Novosphingobium profundi]MBT0667100.1 alpha/beta fold hydrolase [Novosphingobium profundi]
MQRPRRRYLDGRYGQVHGRIARPTDAPDARAILFIHMSPMTGHIFERLVGEMGQDRLAAAFDTPGYGQSDAPPCLPSIEDYADALAEAMEALAPGTPYDVMGYHTGSLTATALAARFPERIGRLVLVGAPIFTPEERATFRAYYGPKAPREDGEHLARRWRGFVHHYRRPGMSLEEVAEHFEEATTGGANAWWGHAAAFDYDLEAALRTLAHPALILKTGDDLAAQTEPARHLSPHITMLDAPGWGHGFATREAGDVAQLLRGWLDGVQDRAIAAPPSALGPCWPPAEAGSFAPEMPQSCE